MDDRQTDRLIEAISNLTAATTEVAVKLKRLANTPHFSYEKYEEILNNLKNQ